MKLRDLIIESMLFEVRLQFQEILGESITDYLGQIMVRLKKGDDLTDDELEQVAALLAGMKVLSIPQYRQAMTKNDIGINPNSVTDLYNLLNKIPRDGKFDALTKQVFHALQTIAPSIFKKELTDIKELSGATREERDQVIAKLNSMFTKINQAFSKAKTATSSTTVAQSAAKP